MYHFLNFDSYSFRVSQASRDQLLKDYKNAGRFYYFNYLHAYTLHYPFPFNFFLSAMGAERGQMWPLWRPLPHEGAAAPRGRGPLRQGHRHQALQRRPGDRRGGRADRQPLWALRDAPLPQQQLQTGSHAGVS